MFYKKLSSFFSSNINLLASLALLISLPGVIYLRYTKTNFTNFTIRAESLPPPALVEKPVTETKDSALNKKSKKTPPKSVPTPLPEIKALSTIAKILALKLPYSSDSLALKENLGISDNTAPQNIYIINGQINYYPFNLATFKIVPDDEVLEITLNGTSIPLTSIPPHKRADYTNGFEIDLSEHLNLGANLIQIKLKDTGGSIGFNIRTISSLRNEILIAIALISLTYLFIFPLAQIINLPYDFVTILLIGVSLRLMFFIAGNQFSFVHDLHAHLDYISFIQNHLAFPINSAESVAFFHPPLYFLISALAASAAQMVMSDDLGLTQRVIQLVSVVASFFFLYFSVQTIRLFFPSFFSIVQKPNTLISFANRLIGPLIALLIMVWPSAVIHSVRIGNEPLLYCFFAAAFYYANRWWLEKDTEDYRQALAFASLATITKATGILLLFTLFILWIYLRFCKKNVHFSKALILPIALSILSIVVTTAPGFLQWSSGKRNNMYMGNAEEVSAGLLVGNAPQNFLWFDLKTFITEPYTSPWDDKYGRQYFNNYLLKTGLFCEWSYAGETTKNAAIIVSFCFLGLLLYAISYLLITPFKSLKRLLPSILTMTILYCGITYMRIKVPVNIDCRYILPIIIPFCLTAGHALRYCGEKKLCQLQYLGILLTSTFIVSSVAFLITLATYI